MESTGPFEDDPNLTDKSLPRQPDAPLTPTALSDSPGNSAIALIISTDLGKGLGPARHIPTLPFC